MFGEGQNIDSTEDIDPTYEKISSISSTISADLVEENDRLKELLICQYYQCDINLLTQQQKIDASFQMYKDRIFTMRDVLKINNLSVEKFWDELNKRNIPFQYEDDIEVLDEDIEDWI